MTAPTDLPWMLLDELISLRTAAKAPTLTPKQQSQIQDAANWGVLEEPRYDAKPMPELIQLFAFFENPTEATREVREKYGQWSIGSVGGMKGTITRKLVEAETNAAKTAK